MVQANPSGKVTLGYFNLRGATRGNVARYLLAYVGAEWDETTWLNGTGEWEKTAPTLMNFASLPYLIDGDFKISETYAVHNYIAQKYCPELIRETPQERARAHQLQRLANDQLVNAKMSFFKGEIDRVGCAAKIMDGLDVVGKLLNDDRHFLMGSKPCIADFCLMTHIDYTVHLTD